MACRSYRKVQGEQFKKIPDQRNARGPEDQEEDAPGRYRVKEALNEPEPTGRVLEIEPDPELHNDGRAGIFKSEERGEGGI